MTGQPGDIMVVGLDGVPHWLLRQLADSGVMPRTAAILPQGGLRPLCAPIPDISSTSWAAFLTGADSGRNGVFGFIDLIPGSYQPYFPNLRDLKAVPVWQTVAAYGGRSLVVNVPGTYPAPAMTGTLVSGFVAPDFDRAVHPPQHRAELARRGYLPDVEVGDVAGDADGFLDRVDETLAARRRGLDYLLAAEPDARLTVFVFTETDRVHHFLWRDLMAPASARHDRILDFYARLDEAIGHLADRAGDGDLVLVSDHGFGSVDTQFNVNAWLRDTGHLALPPGGALSDIGPATTAFALDPGRIFLNTADRFPGGTRLDEQALTAELTAGLLALRRGRDGSVAAGGPGEPVVAQVLRGTELYHGPCAGAAADLIVMPAPGVQIRAALAGADWVMDTPLTGTHTREDALLWCRGEYDTTPADMRDVAPTILDRLGIPPLPTMDGRVLDRSAPTLLSRKGS